MLFLIAWLSRFGHIEFESEEATEKAVALAGTRVDGREIRVDFSEDKRQSGGGGRGGFGDRRGGFGDRRGGRGFGDRRGGRGFGDRRGGRGFGDRRGGSRGFSPAAAGPRPNKITFDD